MNKHTPGPWRYYRENGSQTTGQHMIAGATPGYLAEVRDCGSGDVQANARLIAAAPESHASNVELAAIVREICLAYGHPLPEAALARSDAAIKKATGAPQ